MAAQAGLCLAGSETPKDTFCRVVAHALTLLFLIYRSTISIKSSTSTKVSVVFILGM